MKNQQEQEASSMIHVMILSCCTVCIHSRTRNIQPNQMKQDGMQRMQGGETLALFQLSSWGREKVPNSEGDVFARSYCSKSFWLLHARRVEWERHVAQMARALYVMRESPEMRIDSTMLSIIYDICIVDRTETETNSCEMQTYSSILCSLPTPAIRLCTAFPCPVSQKQILEI